MHQNYVVRSSYSTQINQDLLYIFIDIDIKLIYNFDKLKTRRTTQ